MKRFVFFLLLWFFFIPSAIAQESEPLPDAEVLKAANDSILADAYVLYLFEKSAWVLEDVLAASKPTTMSEMGGWFPIGDKEDEDVVKGVFFNKEKSKALFEASFNIKSGTASGKDVVRDLSPEEIKLINVRENVLGAVRTLDTEDLPSCPEGCTFNTEVIMIDEDLYRVYWMLGTAQQGIIPFGCDFSYDCDSEGNIKEFRRYHRTYIPAQLKMDDGSPVLYVVHSHLRFCPLIAPTDIALFLLYGYEAGLSGFKVVSTAYHCVFSFDPETYEINVEQL
jgi:hypothetical protein